ncbi:NirD/YgiW/YdeI family stress tolerance protein [Povalibacter sp.]|uniref:NirD/YgiW/YdeI family stress tolerance protein n=1 Tax=Povalibacter sp. TaxID=1962978 RepID=UPI002F413A14
MSDHQTPRVLLLAVGTTLVAAAALGQYSGPSSTTQYRSVAEVLKNPVDDAPVTLEGYIVKQVDKDKYIFSDGTTEIRVEIDAEDFPATPVNEKTRVQIRGEVDKDILNGPEIDVEAVTLVE